MVNKNQKAALLHSIWFKVPTWMLDAIDEVQVSHKLVTRTEAARLIVVRGLDALGIDTSDVAEEEVSETKGSVERIFIKGENACQKTNA
ncbi:MULTISPECIES: hypothetical protein [unclassified Methanoculleus]|jgi:hypothetical protein|uniref:Uncharacterized protein n=1 Tax=Methanoculleus palmolei TaxID=72612 RepID=A0ABD8A6D1_9EURY|nr:hypothetical protein [Methanoculleus sp. UBA377]WOX55081.1 hypothetical protein R6Y95_06285 [Methanoculleus palmolei]